MLEQVRLLITVQYFVGTFGGTIKLLSGVRTYMSLI